MSDQRQFTVDSIEENGTLFTNDQHNAVSVTFTASGTWNTGSNIDYGPEGKIGAHNPSAPYPKSTLYALLAVNSNNEVVGEGATIKLALQPDETVRFVVNDTHYPNNSGQLTVDWQFNAPAAQQQGAIKVRYSVRELQDKYDSGDKQPLEDLVRAWKGIQDLPSCDENSFFVLGGYHGEPFIYRKNVDALSDVDRYDYWGGYCNHGNILFPTWHRVYLLKLEEALQSIVPGVTMPYWDETSEETGARGIPWVLTDEKFPRESEIDNPLRSFVLPQALSDNTTADGSPENLYRKPAGYETVRYPLSGLVGTPIAQEESWIHNQKYKENALSLLNENVKEWLNDGYITFTKDENDNWVPKERPPTLSQYEKCLRAPNYTVFSNTTSAAEWNLSHRQPGNVAAVSLESPHNVIHLAVGGFDAPGVPFKAANIEGANGDMGENNTAAMDPIFFFHHCHIDRMFWLWQMQNGATHELEIMEGYAGTSSTDSQGPTPDIPPNTRLNLDSPLKPFLKSDGKPYTSKDCVNIETQLGYTYSESSLQEAPQPKRVKAGSSTKTLTVRGINRALFQGSFVLKAYATVQKDSELTMYYLGHHAVFSRWNVTGCANCLTHLEVIAHFPLSNVPAKDVDKAKFQVEIQARQLPGKKAIADAFSRDDIKYEVRD